MGKMHDDQVDTDESLVRRLLAAQFPQWTHLPVAHVPASGTEHDLYRLGSSLVVRMPMLASAVGQAERDLRWLPAIAPHLPIAVPVPLAIGTPQFGYPFAWSVYPWLDGSPAHLPNVEAAVSLAQFVLALQGIDAAAGPPRNGRGGPLAPRDPDVRKALAQLSGSTDTRAAAVAWERALDAPAWDGPPTWLHGDLHPGNMLAHNGNLSGIIDWGCLAVGDPACDLLPAWTFFDSGTREVFRATLGVDDAMWERGRGWALSIGLIALPYYQDTNPELAEIARRAVESVLNT